MSGKSARARRAQAHEYEQRRERYRQVLMANPLPLAEKLRLLQDAEYMADRLVGIASRPPAHWSPEQIAGFAAILADPDARADLWMRILHGQARLDAAADALDADLP